MKEWLCCFVIVILWVRKWKYCLIYFVIYPYFSPFQKSADSNEIPLPPIPTEPGPKPPLPPTAPGSNIQIRRGYDPKAPKAAAPQVQPDKFLISPITGERVPAENMAEHMKISLLDPRWREQRDRVLQEKKEQEQVFAEGKLKQFPFSGSLLS